uniref:Uncharacterized protein n=1 Tax=Cacopsylla melanoneura TaxID=428564 RepID=A0A8D8WN65_9HEMI
MPLRKHLMSPSKSSTSSNRLQSRGPAGPPSPLPLSLPPPGTVLPRLLHLHLSPVQIIRTHRHTPRNTPLHRRIRRTLVFSSCLLNRRTRLIVRSPVVTTNMTTMLTPPQIQPTCLGTSATRALRTLVVKIGT